MTVSKNAKIIIIVILGIIIAYYLYCHFNNTKTTTPENFEPMNLPNNAETISYALDSMQDNDITSLRKMRTKNMAAPGTYKHSSYVAGNRDEFGTWDKYFDDNNDLVNNSLIQSNVEANDNTDISQALFKDSSCTKASCGSNQDCDIEEQFNADLYLPKEVNDNWFETLDEPIPEKDRHLINVYKPIGINTIGSSLKNASYDFRGTPPNPKFVISPFNNSSIDPDTNIKWNY